MGKRKFEVGQKVWMRQGGLPLVVVDLVHARDWSYVVAKTKRGREFPFHEDDLVDDITLVTIGKF